MMKIPMSAAASGLLRALLARSGVSRDRVLLTEFRSVDWQSATFVGERHEIELRIPGPGARDIVDRIVQGIEFAEFQIAGQIVADVAPIAEPKTHDDGSITLKMEALTIAE